MSILPTLFVKGSLRAPIDNAKLQRELDDWVPMQYLMEWFRARESKSGVENRVLILRSETASAKSTGFPPELFKAFVRNPAGGTYGRGIICTQPRVLTAIENVLQMVWKSGPDYPTFLKIGITIGWSTQFNKLKPVKTGLLSATIGTLMQILRSNTDQEIMDTYKFILIDETHERDIMTDMAIYMLKNLLIRQSNNPQCPFVVLMSATFEPDEFLSYFGVKRETNFVWCIGAKGQQITEKWDWNEGRTTNNYYRSAADIVKKIIDEGKDDHPDRGDILIFLPGSGEMVETKMWLDKLNKTLDVGQQFITITLDGETVKKQNDMYKAVFAPLNELKLGNGHQPRRKVILSTNVAETGVTINTLKYSLDAGFNREMEYNPVIDTNGLITKPAPQSRIIQRRGRVGRKFAGVFYPLYPKYVFDKLPKIQHPQILLSDISPVMLDIINEQLRVKAMQGDRDPTFRVADIDVLTRPPSDMFVRIIDKLYLLGFVSPRAPKWRYVETADDLPDPSKQIDRKKYRFGLTYMGYLCHKIDIGSPEMVRMILAGYSYGVCIGDLITIAAYLLSDPTQFAKKLKAGGRATVGWGLVYSSTLGYLFSGEAAHGKAVAANMVTKAKGLVRDDFINGLLIFLSAKRAFSESTSELRKWCKNTKISFRRFMDLLRIREDIFNKVILAGLDVYRFVDSSLDNSTNETFFDTLVRIKRCIYDGFRCNVVVYKDGGHYTDADVKVAVSSDPTAKIAVYHKLSVKFNKKSKQYKVSAPIVSVMDGFVNTDLSFGL